MNTILIIALILFDVALLIAFILNAKKDKIKNGTITEISEERNILINLHNEIKNDLKNTEKKAKNYISNVSKLAAEIEQDVKNSGKIILTDVGNSIDHIAEKLQPQLELIEKEKASLEKLSSKLSAQNTLLQKRTMHAEHLCKLLDGSISIDQLLTDINSTKHENARHLLAKGMHVEEVAKEVDLPQQEVKLIYDLR